MSVETLASVNTDRCVDVANIIKRMALPQPKEEVPPLPFSPGQEANFWFFLVAICHQTSPINRPPLAGVVDGIQRRGWDYLLHAFRVAATNDSVLLTPDRWVTFEEADCTNLFGSNLTEPERRAALIRDLGFVLNNRSWPTIFQAETHCHHRIADSHGEGLLSLLTEFEAFTDPVQKKSVFFLALMANAGLWTYADPEMLPAPVDYHEVRGHMRIGTVILEPALLAQIKTVGRVTVDEDVAIRAAVRDAIAKIASDVGDSPNTLHYFFWNLFRTYCVRSMPDCQGADVGKFPDVYARAVQSIAGRACPMNSVCASANMRPAIDDPAVTTEFY